ncbi:MAG TPA: hypothetical protein VEW69_06260 [Alphaproteobacteria bacterium]|nr:hypothetical protein [Alphaproteobacteria bacterium]
MSSYRDYSRREEARFAVALPVKIFGDKERSGAEWTCTYQVSSRGVRLRQVSTVTEVGQEIWIQRNTRRAKYRVTWIGVPKTSTALQFGAERLESKLIWDDDLRKKLKHKYGGDK